MPPLTRRELLRTTPIALMGVISGCITNSRTTTENTTSTTTVSSSTSTQISSRSPPQSPTPIDNGRAAPAPSCPEGYFPVQPFWIVYGTGPLAGFDLTLDTQTVALGDTLTCKFQNITNGENESGNKKKYDLQYNAESGWHTVFGSKREEVYRTDGAVKHEPSSGFTWEFSFTQEGISNIVENDEYYACGPIKAGSYRFVYWGITSDKEAEENFETDYALGAPFSVTES